MLVSVLVLELVMSTATDAMHMPCIRMDPGVDDGEDAILQACCVEHVKDLWPHT